tara:strand:+ start:381 stop:575 length:195 start_codon:yes stop_codon:yes gene_type:complete
MTKTNETARETATRLYATHGSHAFTVAAPNGATDLARMGEDGFRFAAAVSVWIALWETRKARGR